jgi:2'-hydroxyisoflavone reductase
VRLSRGGDILVPGKKEDPVQYVDVRDIAEWMIRLVEEKTSGTFNGVGPSSSTGMLEFVEKAGEVFDVEKNYVIVDDYEFLKSQHIHHIVPWIMPEGNNYGSARIDNSRGIAAGLTFRPLADTIRDTYDWWYSDALSDEKRAEFEDDPENVLNREKEIIESWRS